ncbi:mitochondrial intermembrane space import and assembly protein 40-B-like [Panonychus citri]|uniref:mitochondrial intermembrane space import and assembly protein 40-B-like n=1 Tax=Panonychus citri TaxID=50023 RepID=UPI002306EDA5|nr:mitochondrial intermembrane space import and assembly protein 40-B-like [Panonychus citri]
MSLCKQIGKDRIILVTPEELSQESNIQLPEIKPEDREPGLILPNGEINWNCPCIGGMASGPCAYQFREAFSCYRASSTDETDNRGFECVEKFAQLQECMSSYPNLYPKRDDEDDDLVGDLTNTDDDIKGTSGSHSKIQDENITATGSGKKNS